MKKGSIGVTTDNIFPIIKKFLYSDHEIFLRELVSNAVDATQKLATLAAVGEYKGELGELRVTVDVNKEKGTITITDRGIGMNADEIEKYINQIAFSGAEEFMEKYKEDAHAIIGHFGLGFYSSFMVSKKVEILTKSYRDEDKAVKWSCKGDPQFELKEIKKEDRGTSIVLHIDDENKSFLEESKISELLNKYCKFLPIEIAFGKKKEWKDGKEEETDEPNIINDIKPAWTKKPADLTEEDYNNFYRQLYPMSEDPLFHIHLNVDYPFNLTGILYFPRIKSNVEVQKNKIQLYSNQVFVTDSVEGIVPEFLTLLHGVIDSPDIPLNVSRSYLQSDGNVKKISSHITKKVADRLYDIFKEDRADFEAKWDDLKLFITYGMLSEEKFYEKLKSFALFKNTDNKNFTYEEYQALIKDEQTDKEGNLIYLYTNDQEQQHSFIEAANEKGYDVLVMDGYLDAHYIGKLEQSFDKSRFVRVDSDVVDKLILKDKEVISKITVDQQNIVKEIFSAELPTIEKKSFTVSCEPMGEQEAPVIITQNEWMRRMKDMSALQGGGMGFYGEMPDSFTLVVNANHAKVNTILSKAEQELGVKLKEVNQKVIDAEAQKDFLDKAKADKKAEDIPQEEKDALEAAVKNLDEANKEKKDLLYQFGKKQALVKQLIDLALLANNMLKGKDLTQFVKRSVELL